MLEGSWKIRRSKDGYLCGNVYDIKGVWRWDNCIRGKTKTDAEKSQNKIGLLKKNSRIINCF